MQFESEHGSLASVAAVEQRRRESAGKAAEGPIDALHVLMLQQRCRPPRSTRDGQNRLSCCNLEACAYAEGSHLTG